MKKYIYLSNYITMFLTVAICFSYFYLREVSNRVELNVEENMVVHISDNTVAFPIFVDGTKCIVTENNDHGAISCDWSKRH